MQSQQSRYLQRLIGLANPGLVVQEKLSYKPKGENLKKISLINSN